MSLTDIECKSAKPKEKSYKLSDSRGLYLEVYPNGKKHWRYKYRFLGKEKRMVLGEYPETPLAEAREKHLAAHKQVSQGLDPNAVRQSARELAKRAHENTFAAVAKLWFAHKSQGIAARTAKFTWGRFENDILPTLGHKPLNSITAADVIAVLQRVEARGAHELARRLKQSCAEVFRYAVSHGYADRNPVKDFEARDVLAKYVRGQHSAIEPKELPSFLVSMNNPHVRLYPLTRLAMRLLMFTFVRTSELIEAKWAEFDFNAGLWVIPAERMKMRREHVVPLCRQAISILKDIQAFTGHREYVFPAMNNPRKHMSNNTILQALASMGYKGKMTGHGFRALAASALQEDLGYDYAVIDVQLAHAKKDKIRTAYDRAQFLEQRTGMMQAWGDYLDKQAQVGAARTMRQTA